MKMIKFKRFGRDYWEYAYSKEHLALKTKNEELSQVVIPYCMILFSVFRWVVKQLDQLTTCILLKLGILKDFTLIVNNNKGSKIKIALV